MPSYQGRSLGCLGPFDARGLLDLLWLALAKVWEGLWQNGQGTRGSQVPRQSAAGSSCPPSAAALYLDTASGAVFASPECRSFAVAPPVTRSVLSPASPASSCLKSRWRWRIIFEPPRRPPPPALSCLNHKVASTSPRTCDSPVSSRCCDDQC